MLKKPKPIPRAIDPVGIAETRKKLPLLASLDPDARRLRVLARVVLALADRPTTAGDLKGVVLNSTFADVAERDAVLRDLVEAGVLEARSEPALNYGTARGSTGHVVVYALSRHVLPTRK